MAGINEIAAIFTIVGGTLALIQLFAILLRLSRRPRLRIRAETTEVADAFSRAHAEFEPMTLPDVNFQNENRRALSSPATLTIWPQDYGGNGMFVAAWRRKT